MSVKEDVRKHQFEVMDPESDLGKKTEALYSGIDSMTSEQKTLLISQALGIAHNAVMGIAEAASEPGKVIGYAQFANGLIALAGYTQETLREEAGSTTTGDSKVRGVIEGFRQLCSDIAKADMSPELRAEADALSDRVNARVAETGEDFNEVFNDEFGKVKERLAKHAKPTEATEDHGTGYGMYL